MTPSLRGAGRSCFLSCRESGQLQWVEVDSSWPASGDSIPFLPMYLTVQTLPKPLRGLAAGEVAPARECVC